LQCASGTAGPTGQPFHLDWVSVFLIDVPWWSRTGVLILAQKRDELCGRLSDGFCLIVLKLSNTATLFPRGAVSD
jgi:hypothetical protein